MLNRLFGQKPLNLFVLPEELERRLHDAVEQEGEVHQHGKANHLEPFETLPAQAEGHDPDDERPASVNGRAGCCAHAPSNGEAEEVEAADSSVSFGSCSGVRNVKAGGRELTQC